jgi:hypothetical protein
MGRAARTKAAASDRARDRVAAVRAEQERARVRRRLLLAGASVAIVIVLAAVAVVVGQRSSSSGRQAEGSQGPVTIAAVAAKLGSVSPATFDAVGAGNATGLKTLSGAPGLTANGLPEVLYVGGEYCPFCAAERWALATALSRFGTLSGLHFIHSSPTDGDIPTLSFYKSGYSSKYLSFVPVEWYGEADDPSTPFGHVYLQQPTAQEKAVFDRYAGQSLPFVDIGNQYIAGAQYDPADLSGLNWAQIAADLQDPSSQVARDVDGAANVLTAAMCKATHGQPGGVCSSAGVKAAAGGL